MLLAVGICLLVGDEHAAVIGHPSHKGTFIHVHVPTHIGYHVHVFHLREHSLVNFDLIEQLTPVSPVRPNR